MSAERIMITQLIVAKHNEPVSDAIMRMHEAKLRMLPVINKNNQVMGIISTFCVLAHIVPDYLISGDLNEISFAPDMGILHREYVKGIKKTVDEMMDKKPLLVHTSDSLISVAASIAGHGQHKYALVVDKEKTLVGIISAGDILADLDKSPSEIHDA